MLHEIESELRRLNANDVRVSIDETFDPEAGELVKVEYDGAYWHLLPKQFLELLKDVRSGGRGEAVRVAIEQNATFVWHGPEPEASRDTAP